MEVGGYRLKIILLAFILTLAGAFALKHLGYHNQVVEPITRAFAQIPEVTQVEATRQQGGIKLVISLAECDQLDKVMTNLLAAAQAHDSIVKIEIKDQANADLEGAYYQMHFAIEQAVAQGDFRDMADQVAEIAAASGLRQRITITSDYIYLQLHEQDDYYYQVVSRREDPLLIRYGG